MSGKCNNLILRISFSPPVIRIGIKFKRQCSREYDINHVSEGEEDCYWCLSERVQWVENKGRLSNDSKFPIIQKKFMEKWLFIISYPVCPEICWVWRSVSQVNHYRWQKKQSAQYSLSDRHISNRQELLRQRSSLKQSRWSIVRYSMNELSRMECGMANGK